MGNETILFVDDEEAISEPVVELLENLVIRVVSYNNSDKAFEAFAAASDKDDIVITDRIMPRMTDHELAAKMRAINPQLPLVPRLQPAD